MVAKLARKRLKISLCLKEDQLLCRSVLDWLRFFFIMSRKHRLINNTIIAWEVQKSIIEEFQLVGIHKLFKRKYFAIAADLYIIDFSIE